MTLLAKPIRLQRTAIAEEKLDRIREFLEQELATEGVASPTGEQLFDFTLVVLGEAPTLYNSYAQGARWCRLHQYIPTERDASLATNVIAFLVRLRGTGASNVRSRDHLQHLILQRCPNLKGLRLEQIRQVTNGLGNVVPVVRLGNVEGPHSASELRFRIEDYLRDYLKRVKRHRQRPTSDTDQLFWAVIYEDTLRQLEPLINQWCLLDHTDKKWPIEGLARMRFVWSRLVDQARHIWAINYPSRSSFGRLGDEELLRLQSDGVRVERVFVVDDRPSSDLRGTMRKQCAAGVKVFVISEAHAMELEDCVRNTFDTPDILIANDKFIYANHEVSGNKPASATLFHGGTYIGQARKFRDRVKLHAKPWNLKQA